MVKDRKLASVRRWTTLCVAIYHPVVFIVDLPDRVNAPVIFMRHYTVIYTENGCLFAVNVGPFV